MNKIVITGFTALAFLLASCNNKSQSASDTGTDSANVGAAANAGTANPAEAPVIKFEEDSYEFGKVKDGEKVSHEFKFTNSGKTPLIISNATATCGCTIPDYPREPIAPGQSAAIKVVFDSAGKSGMQRKVVTITSNANPATSEVYLIGEVEAKQ